ncbi:MAG: hypothetical protein NTZ05_10450 [Chloroflexi bacterium]|nr:hypothetical protein [Chloroflexota bacterium]
MEGDWAMEHEGGRTRRTRGKGRFAGLLMEPVLPWLAELTQLEPEVAGRLTSSYLDLLCHQGECGRSHYLAAVLSLDPPTFIRLLARYTDHAEWAPTVGALLAPDDRDWLEAFLRCFQESEHEEPEED